MEKMTLLNYMFNLDIPTLISTLIWGDFSLALLAFGYYKFHIANYEEKLIKNFGIAKTLQAIAWLLLFLRGNVPDAFSIYFGNTLLYISFYMEANLMMKMMKDVPKKRYTMQSCFLGLAMAMLYIFEIMLGAANIRISISSFSIAMILAYPTWLYIRNKQSSAFKKYVGFFILIFLVVLSLRGIQALFVSDLNIFSSNLLQSATFITLNLLLFINGAGFLLLMYESADQQLKVSSELDPLTHVYNRRYFMSKAEHYMLRHMRSNRSISLLFIDIDNFKSVNDTYGHTFGDEVLKKLAGVLTESVRPIDICCRFGGEEFAVLLYESSSQEALAVGNRIREAVMALEFNEKNYQCTVSIGAYSSVPNEENALVNFIEKSDLAMYNAKHSGKNRVRVYGQERGE